MQNHIQEQETLQNNFDSICESIVNDNTVLSQPLAANSQNSVIDPNFKEYATPIINKLKPPTRWIKNSKIDQPGYITTEQLIRLIELRHKYAEQFKFYKTSTLIISIISLLIFFLLCIFFGLHQINII